jgi:hypothetical protein
MILFLWPTNQQSKTFVRDVSLDNETGGRTDRYSKLRRGDGVERMWPEGVKSVVKVKIK